MAQQHVITGSIRALERQDSLLISGQMGCGKAQPLNAKVMTPTGWKLMGEIKEGEKICKPGGGYAFVTGVWPQGELDVYKVTFSDGAVTHCCEQHLWSVRTPQNKHAGNGFVVKRLGALMGDLSTTVTHSGGRKNAKWFVPVGLVDHPRAGLPLDPYLLGALLGDGSLSAPTAVGFSSVDGFIVGRVSSALPPGVAIRKKPGTTCDWSITTGSQGIRNPLRAILRDLGLAGLKSNAKFIPEKYLRGSVQQRAELLRGLMDTDGSVDKRGHSPEYTTTSPQLAANVQSLVRSLGGLASMSSRTTTFTYKGKKKNGQVSYRLTLRLPQWLNPFSLPRKASRYKPRVKYDPARSIVSIESAGQCECQCISVDSTDNLYVTDDYIVTHNTLMAQAVVQGHAAVTGPGGYRALVFCPPHLTHKWEREIQMTVRNAHIHHVRSYHDLTKLKRNIPPCGRGWWIVSNTRAKMGAKWKPVYYKGRYPAINRDKVDKEHDSTLSHYGMPYCPRCRWPILKKSKDGADALPPSHEEMCAKKFTCQNCDEPLWQYTSEIDRWPVATYIHQHMKNHFQYLVIDESHQTKSADSAVGQAMGSLSAAIKKRIALSGTIIGGYAWHIRPMLYRLSPSSLIDEGLTWKDEMGFNERYGRIEKRITETEDKGGSDNRQSRGKVNTRTQKFVKPGVMPTLFGRHIIQNTVFLSLDEVSDNLPSLEESVIPVPMDAELEVEYKRVEEELVAACKEALKRRDKTMLSKMLQTLLGYPDYPHGWGDIGYTDTGGKFHLVVTPLDLDDKRVRQKEKELVDFCLEEKNLGRKVWVYCVMTDKRDVNARLHVLLEQAGLKTQILRASVSTDKREAWIADHAPGVDVMISHPQLVETGLDLFDPAGRYNFSSLAWYSTGYNLFTLRQASARSWRIGQKLPCKVKYFYYAGTMQARAMTLMGKKLSASTSVEGKFSSEGLAALAGDEGSMEVALARSLVERLDDTDVGRAWARITAPKVKPEPSPVVIAAPNTPLPKPVTPVPKPQVNFNRFAPPGKVVRKQASFF